MLQRKEWNGKLVLILKSLWLTFKNNKPSIMHWKKTSFKLEIRTFKLPINCKNIRMIILISNLKRNLKNLNQSQLNHKAKVNNPKLKRKFNNQLNKKVERKKKETNLHLKFQKLLSMKLFRKHLHQ